MTGEGAQQAQAGFHPVQVLARAPERSRLRVPGEVQKVSGKDALQQPLWHGLAQQIGSMPVQPR